MKLPVLLKDSFLWIMVNLDYRKCFQLYEKINPVTHLVGSTEMIVCDLLAPQVPLFFAKMQASFLATDRHRPSTFFSWNWPTLGQSSFTVLKESCLCIFLAVCMRTARWLSLRGVRGDGKCLLRWH